MIREQRNYNLKAVRGHPLVAKLWHRIYIAVIFRGPDGNCFWVFDVTLSIPAIIVLSYTEIVHPTWSACDPTQEPLPKNA